jgi:hypothetical protein
MNHLIPNGEGREGAARFPSNVILGNTQDQGKGECILNRHWATASVGLHGSDKPRQVDLVA